MSQTKLFLKSLIYISLSPHHVVAVFRSYREMSIGEVHADIGKQDEPVGLCCGWGATCCCYDLSKMSEESDKLILLSDSNGKLYNNGQVYSNGTNAKYTTSHKFLKYDVSADGSGETVPIYDVTDRDSDQTLRVWSDRAPFYLARAKTVNGSFDNFEIEYEGMDADALDEYRQDVRNARISVCVSAWGFLGLFAAAVATSVTALDTDCDYTCAGNSRGTGSCWGPRRYMYVKQGVFNDKYRETFMNENAGGHSNPRESVPGVAELVDELKREVEKLSIGDGYSSLPADLQERVRKNAAFNVNYSHAYWQLDYEAARLLGFKRKWTNCCGCDYANCHLVTGVLAAVTAPVAFVTAILDFVTYCKLARASKVLNSPNLEAAVESMENKASSKVIGSKVFENNEETGDENETDADSYNKMLIVVLISIFGAIFFALAQLLIYNRGWRNGKRKAEWSNGSLMHRAVFSKQTTSSKDKKDNEANNSNKEGEKAAVGSVSLPLDERNGFEIHSGSNGELSGERFSGHYSPNDNNPHDHLENRILETNNDEVNQWNYSMPSQINGEEVRFTVPSSAMRMTEYYNLRSVLGGQQLKGVAGGQNVEYFNPMVGRP